jgi:hypothetical protein
MQKSIHIAIACTLGLVYLSPLAASIGNKSGKYVFVETGQRIKIKKINNSPRDFNVTVFGAHPKVVYFSDQPKRDYGTIDNKQFIRNWKLANAYFKKNPPGVLINYFDPTNGKNHEIKTGVFTLFNPEYNAKKRIVSYTATQIAGSPVKEAYKYYPVIFIDDATGSFHNCVRAMHCPANLG